MGRTMKKLILVAILLLTACEDDNPPLPPYASVQIKGKAAMGVVSAGKITAYDFSQCKKGPMLSSVELKDSPLFQLTIVPDKPEHPVLFELSNFTYQEEYSGALVTVPIARVLSSAVVVKPGDHKNLTISFWTNLAYARTVHRCTKVSNNAINHINTSNEVLSKTLTFNVSADVPAAVDKATTADNLPSVLYGAANAAIASYTEGLGGTTPHVLSNSSLLAEMAFLDLSFDGVLEGTAQDGGLIFAGVALNTNIYRTEIPNHMAAIISVFSGKSGLGEALFMGLVNTVHNNNNDKEKDSDIFSDFPTISLGDMTAPKLIGKEIVKCIVTTIDSTTSKTQVDVKFDVIDLESSFDVSIEVTVSAPEDKILLHKTVYWRSGLKPIVTMIHTGRNTIITSRNVTFTNRFKKQLIVKTSAEIFGGGSSCKLSTEEVPAPII